MPAIAAHYQLGQMALALLPNDLASPLKDEQPLFALGCQGPDLLFYYQPWHQNPISSYGHFLHNQKAADFIAPLLNSRTLTKKQQAYLAGFICHYALDKAAHPLINRLKPDGIGHRFIESAFDYIIIEKFNLSKQRQNYLNHHYCKKEILAGIYPTIPAKKLGQAAFSFHHITAFIGHPGPVAVAEKILNMKQLISSLALPQNLANNHQAYQIYPLFEQSVTEAVNLLGYFCRQDYQQLIVNLNYNFEGKILCD